MKGVRSTPPLGVENSCKQEQRTKLFGLCQVQPDLEKLRKLHSNFLRGIRQGIMDFKLKILGCGSAIPAFGRYSSAQVLSTHGKNFLIDCADATQFRLKALKVNTSRLQHIFISHLHGDHCFGLISVISTFSLAHRNSDLYIHAQPDLQKILQPQIDYFCRDMEFKVVFENFDPLKNARIYEDRSLTVETIPLSHGVPCCGFMFREKEKAPHLDKSKLEFYNVGVEQMKTLKEGGDLRCPDGAIIPNGEFMRPPTPAKSFAYCADTMYRESICPIIQGADCLFHEATFSENQRDRARATKHSTAKDAALIAKKAGVKKLLIGHFSARYESLEPLLEEARSIFPDTCLATDGKSFEW